MSSFKTRVRVTVINITAALTLFYVGFILVQGFDPPPTPDLDKAAVLKIGYESHYPYQFESGDLQATWLSGVDTELLRETFSRAGYRVEFVSRGRAQALAELESGQLDAVSLASMTEQRKTFAYFSAPYLTLRTALFFRREMFAELPGDCRQLRQLVDRGKASLAYSAGVAYPSELEAVLEDSASKELIHPGPSDRQNLTDLEAGHVDLVVADQLGGTSLVLKNGWNTEVGCVMLGLPDRDARVMFSKKSVAFQVVEDFNLALAQMDADGSRAKIVRAYYYPTMLNMLAHGLWLDEIYFLAVAAAAMSGIFLARKTRTNLVGAFLLAAAPACGGGLLRDLVAGRRPVAVVADPSILLTVGLLVLLAFLVFRIVDIRSPRATAALDNLDIDHQPILVFFDGLGLAAFTVLGVLVAMQWHCEPLWLWGPLLAAMTNGGGSALRDVILWRPVSLVTSTQPYVEVSILWGWLLSCYLTYSSRHLPNTVLNLQIAIAATVLGVGATYMAARLTGVRSPGYGVIRRDPEQSTI